MRPRIAHRSIVSLVLVLVAGCSAQTVVGGGGEKPVDACGNTTSGPTTVTGTLTGGTTWDAAHSPYVIARGDTLKVATGATLTLDECTKVVLESGAGIHVDGHLQTNGTPQSYVVITGNGGGRWNDISVTAPGWLGFNYTTIDHGGLPAADGGAGATIVANGGTAGNPITAPCLGFMNLSITDSGSVGLLMKKNAFFVGGSDTLAITGTGADVASSADAPLAVPLALDVASLVDLPAPLDLNGKQPGIWVRGGTLGQEAMLYDAGVPYLIHGDLTLDAPLDMRAGVTLAFAPHSTLTVHVSQGGAIDAGGTASQPITFTSWSDSPGIGDWVGVMFEGDGTAPVVTGQMHHVTIEYAGGANTYSGQACEPNGYNENAALGFFGAIPTAGDFTDLTLAHTPSSGIVEGWTGDSVDLESANTFTDLAECAVVRPIPASGCTTEPTCL